MESKKEDECTAVEGCPSETVCDVPIGSQHDCVLRCACVTCRLWLVRLMSVRGAQEDSSASVKVWGDKSRCGEVWGDKSRCVCVWG